MRGYILTGAPDATRAGELWMPPVFTMGEALGSAPAGAGAGVVPHRHACGRCGSRVQDRDLCAPVVLSMETSFHTCLCLRCLLGHVLVVPVAFFAAVRAATFHSASCHVPSVYPDHQIHPACVCGASQGLYNPCLLRSLRPLTFPPFPALLYMSSAFPRGFPGHQAQPAGVCGGVAPGQGHAGQRLLQPVPVDAAATRMRGG